MLCMNCNKETNNPKYCSKSCSAIQTNKLYPKKKCKRKCLNCENPVLSYRHNRCQEHLEEYKRNKYKTKTIGEYRDMLSVKDKHPSWLHSHIRSFARSWLKHLTKLPCKFCNYNKFVELAHIKPVSSYNYTTLLSEVNSEDNVIQLCPNCHWEFDNLPRPPLYASILPV